VACVLFIVIIIIMIIMMVIVMILLFACLMYKPRPEQLAKMANGISSDNEEMPNPNDELILD
jgi:flagellar basal body-associated protein FliL